MALDIVWAGERCVVGVGVYRESIGIYEGENEKTWTGPKPRVFVSPRVKEFDCRGEYVDLRKIHHWLSSPTEESKALYPQMLFSFPEVVIKNKTGVRTLGIPFVAPYQATKSMLPGV